MSTLFKQTNQPGMTHVFGDIYVQPKLIKKVTNAQHNIEFYRKAEMPLVCLALLVIILHFTGVGIAQDEAWVYTCVGMVFVVIIGILFNHKMRSRHIRKLSEDITIGVSKHLPTHFIDTIKNNMHHLSKTKHHTFTFPVVHLDNNVNNGTHIDVHFVPQHELPKSNTSTLHFMFDVTQGKMLVVVGLDNKQINQLQSLTFAGVIQDTHDT